MVDGSLDTACLHEMCGVCKEAIRKDLTSFEKLGLIKRSYGKIHVRDLGKISRYMREQGLLSKVQRTEAIEVMVKSRSRIRISYLADYFKVSQLTIRKDIETLCLRSNILKNHGEVFFDPENPVRKTTEPSSSISLDSAEEKIARRVMDILRPGEAVYLDDSPFSIFIATHIALDNSSPILTAGMRVMQILLDRGYPSETILLPTCVSTEDSHLTLHPVYADVCAPFSLGTAVFALSRFRNGSCEMAAASPARDCMKILSLAKKSILCLKSRDIFPAVMPYPVAESLTSYPLEIPPDLRHRVEIVTDDGGMDGDYDILRSSGYSVFIYDRNNALRNLTNTQRTKIGFLYSVSSTNDARTVCLGIEEAIKSTEYQFIGIGIPQERQSIMKSIRALKDARIDILLLFVTNYEIGHFIVSQFARSQVRIISIDIEYPHTTFFGVDNYFAGVFAGFHLSKFVGERWQGKVDRVFTFNVESAGKLTQQRLSGMIEELKKTSSDAAPRIIAYDLDMLKRLEGNVVIERLASELAEYNVFLSFNEKSTLYLHDIAHMFPEDRKIIIVGHNYNIRIDSLMKSPDSRLIGCVDYHPASYGEQLLRLLPDIQNSSIRQKNYSTLSWISNPYLSGETEEADADISSFPSMTRKRTLPGNSKNCT